jgi:magnesium chelatase accessory protein
MTSAARKPQDSSSFFGFDYPDFGKEGRDWPNREKSSFIEAAGLRWHIQRMGNGPKLLLIHGTGGATHSFRDVMPLLAAHFDILAADLPGHGFTQAPEQNGFSLPGMARAVSALLHKLDFTPDLAIGHSAGAAILIEMAQRAFLTPNAIIGINAALMPFPGLAQKLFPSLARLFVLNPFVPRLFAWTASERAVERLLEGTGSRLDPRGNDLYRRLFAKSGHAHAALGMMAKWELEPLIEKLPKLPVPLHLIVGDRDAAVPPSDAEAIRKRLPGLTITRIKGAGHLAHEEKTEEVVADIMTVWNGLAGSPIWETAPE